MLTQPLRILTAALTLMSAATATELPRKAVDLRPPSTVRARHRPAHELTDVCRVEPVVAAPTPIALPAPIAVSSCTDAPPANKEASQ